MPALVAGYEEVQGHPPGERATYALDRRAADETRPPKPAAKRSLSELRAAWRESAIRAFGACVVYRLAERTLRGLRHEPGLDERSRCGELQLDHQGRVHPPAPVRHPHRGPHQDRHLDRRLLQHTTAP
ncbi:MAG: putative TraA-like protein, partial [Streptosporangiaceae bacterium]|nr:putative TraA-like protein [Streptosporangiaceae bacterium]